MAEKDTKNNNNLKEQTKTPTKKIEDVPMGNKYTELINTLQHYVDDLSRVEITVPEYIAKHTTLYFTLKGILELDDYNEFKKRWDMISGMFNENSDKIEKMVFKHDNHEFQGNNSNDKTFLTLMSVLTTLSDVSTRQVELKAYDINIALESIKLQEVAKRNILAYYR